MRTFRAAGSIISGFAVGEVEALEMIELTTCCGWKKSEMSR